MEQTELVVRDALHGRHRGRLLIALAMSALLVACSSDDPVSDDDPAGSSSVPAAESSSTTSATTRATAPATSSAPTVTTPVTGSPDTAPTAVTTVPHTVLTAPEGDAFYTPPEPIPGNANGDLIWARPIEGPPPGTAAWLVLYRSESVAGDPIAVSGVVVGPAQSDGQSRPVLSWAHGTTGLGDQCAPTRASRQSSIDNVLAIGIVSLGYTFVATDYEGLGTPGVHPYLVGQSEGRGVLDIVRAAAQIDGSGVGADSPVAILGHSQGGHAALMAGELAATYAPDLGVVGTVAIAPPGDLTLIEQRTGVAGNMLTGGFGMMMDAGFAAAYPGLPANALVTDEGVPVLDAIGATCTTEAFQLAADAEDVQLDGTQNPDWLAVFEANSPGNVAPSAPVLIVHGSEDDVVPPVLSELVEAGYCDLGVQVQRTVYEDADHSSVVTQGLGEMQAWIAARVAGLPAPTTC